MRAGIVAISTEPHGRVIGLRSCAIVYFLSSWFATAAVASPPTTTATDADEKSLQAEVDECRRLTRLGLDDRVYLRRMAPTRLADWRSAAERGSAAALWLMAGCYGATNVIGQDAPLSLSYLRLAANKGYGPAMHVIGLVCDRVENDPERAATWFRAAANQGCTEGLYDLGHFYQDGRGVERDPAKGAALWREAADAGDEQAICALAWAYREGKGLNVDDAEAVRLYHRAASLGQVHAIEELARRYLEGNGVATDEAVACQWVQRAAEGLQLDGMYAIPPGDAPELQVRKLTAAVHASSRNFASVGAWYNAYGSERDFVDARKWFTLAADKGSEWAMDQLGSMHHTGRGGSTDHAAAVKLFRAAADRGHAEAMHHLARMYLHGFGVPADLVEAAKWYRKSAEAGDEFGMAEWAACLFHGKGVARDTEAAVAWYEKSASAGDIRAMRDLASIYHAGEVVPRNDAKAAPLYLRAGQRGHPAAMLPLATMYCNGRGFARDFTWARFWLMRAKGAHVAVPAELEQAMTRKMRTRWQRAAPTVAPAFGALAALVGLIRLGNIRHRLDAEAAARIGSATSPAPAL